jgi:hypothetical protein
MKKYLLLYLPLLLVSVVLMRNREAAAIGPRNVTAGGMAVKWSSMPIAVHLETDFDVRGKDVTPLVNEALDAWVDLGESDLTLSEESLDAAVDQNNVCCFFFDAGACPAGPTDDGTNPLVIDEDGEITADFFGLANKFTTLGFASIVSFVSSTGSAVKGEAVFNAACLNGVEIQPGCTLAGPLSFSDDDFISFIVHELGHFFGLDHSQVNLVEATDGSPLNDDLITTMFPTFIVGNGGNFKTPERDDEVGLAQLYPSATFASATWTIEGTVFDEDGATGFQCADLIARNVADPKVDAISALSGDFSPAGAADGSYEILGLTPGETYKVEVQPIGSSFTGSSGYTPCRGSSGEPDPPQFDSQTPATTYSKGAGETQSGVDFTLTGVSALTLPSSGAALLENSDDPNINAAISEIELKSQTSDSCELPAGDSGGGCSLIPDKNLATNR